MNHCTVVTKHAIDRVLSGAPMPGKHTMESWKQAPEFGTVPFTILEDVAYTERHAELHRTEADVFYCLEGEATFVYGGALVGGHERKEEGGATNPNEWRGTDIENGVTVTVGAGDWVWIPAGQPHYHFSGTKARLLVIKVPIDSTN
ncbi:MAG: hypothetical protein EXS55_04250 [Candidatus Magasanikbacteria bacterium]|nr:hypothetical protein [Candidatus Magasanikbacteria bacterium]